jgi:hypothetical protein
MTGRLMRRRRFTGDLAVMVATASIVATGTTMASRGTKVSFEFAPSAVPRHSYAAGSIHVHLRTVAPPDTRASRVRFDFDNSFKFAPDSVPTCRQEDIFNSQIDMATAMARCGSANIGSGTVKATSGTTTYKPCVLAFNGPREGGVPTVLLFVRFQFSPPVADCSNPSSNHGGDVTLLVKGFLRRSPLDRYRKKLTLNRLNRVQPFPLTSLNLTFQKDDYISARCGRGDSRRGWQLRTAVGYVKPRSVEVVKSAQRCSRTERASFHAAGLRE